jgi:hypothetical protein
MGEGLARGLLLASASGFCAFGAATFVHPPIVGLVDIELASPTAATDVRAVFGGMELGLGAFVVWCAADAARHRVGSVAVMLVFGGMVLGRVVGALLDGPTLATGLLGGAELGGFFAGLLAYRAASRP